MYKSKLLIVHRIIGQMENKIKYIKSLFMNVTY